MELKLYNSLTRAKERLDPLDWRTAAIPEPDRAVRMYVCGPTVYDLAHIGNARPLIVFDVLFRLLRHLYGPDHVKYVRNITDVDDKINARAAERGISIRALTEETYAAFNEDVAALGCLPPTVEPRATEHIPEMQALIERLVGAGHAYVAEEHVLFDVPSMPDYGRLSRRPLDEMIAGARVEVAPYKRNPQDFVLWKPSKPGEPSWPSPSGIATPGRPGWHLECSAMAWKHLGEEFDIHGGGIDLVFPHHENEIAQSRCAFHTPVMAQVWMHNGFLQVEGEKMSKSLGNFVTIRELLTGWGGRPWHGEVIRLAMLQTHYRQPIDWTLNALEEAERTLDRWYQADTLDVEGAAPDQDFLDALADDLNTPKAIARLHAIFSGLSTPSSATADRDAKRRLKASAQGLGLMERSARTWFEARQAASGIDGADVNKRILARNAARKAKNFAEADRIRDELAAMGVVLKDSKDGTTWELAR